MDNLFYIASYYFGVETGRPSFVVTNDGNLLSHY